MNILTFDIEEWFHIAGSQPKIKYWNQLEYRSKYIVEGLLELLANYNIKATFLIVGWLAKSQPEIVKLIHSYGHEIGSHSQFHGLVYEMSEKEFRSDLLMSIACIEDLIGGKVEIFRAPSFSVKSENITSFFSTLAECGVRYDLSIFPSRRYCGGITGFLISHVLCLVIKVTFMSCPLIHLVL